MLDTKNPFYNTKDPLVEKVRSVIKENDIRRRSTDYVNEMYGVVNPRALPSEKRGEYDQVLEKTIQNALKDPTLLESAPPIINGDTGGPPVPDGEKIKKKVDTSDEASPPGYTYSSKIAEETLDEGPTKKHFQQTADLLKQIPDAAKRKEMAQHHAGLYASQNPRFDRAKFLSAAGVIADTTPEVKKLKFLAKNTKPGDVALHEISKKLASRYIDQANKSGDVASYQVAVSDGDDGKAIHTVKKRMKGIKLAQKKVDGKVNVQELSQDTAVSGQDRLLKQGLAAKRLTKEENLQELSKNTLKRYIKKAGKDYDRIQNTPESEASLKDLRKFDNHARGIAKAKEKLKETTIGSIQEEIANHLYSELNMVLEMNDANRTDAFFKTLTEEQIAIMEGGYYDSKTGDYVIQKGDTLSQIAQAKGMTVSQLQKLNPGLSDPNKIAAGGKLVTKQATPNLRPGENATPPPATSPTAKPLAVIPPMPAAPAPTPVPTTAAVPTAPAAPAAAAAVPKPAAPPMSSYAMPKPPLASVGNTPIPTASVRAAPGAAQAAPRPAAPAAASPTIKPVTNPITLQSTTPTMSDIIKNAVKGPTGTFMGVPIGTNKPTTAPAK